jgi:hypothetical protein
LETPPETPLPLPECDVSRPGGNFRLPADYYSTAPGGQPIFPRWVPIGCGAAALIALLAIFIGGAVLMRGGGASIVNWAVSAVRKDVDQAMSADVPLADRTALDREIETLRKNMEGGRVKLERVKPLLTSLQQAVADDKITRGEAEKLIRQLHEVNAATK